MDKAAIKSKVIEATKGYLVMSAYLWVILGLFAVYRAVILGQKVSVLGQGVVIFNALLLGKVMITAKELRLGEVSKDRPLIYPTLLRSALFAIVLALFKVIEEAVRGLFKGESFQQSIADIGGGTWEGILCVTAIMFVALIPFFAFTELQRVFGKARLRDLFFRSGRLEQAVSGEAAKEN
jgi:hypothetical protein